MHLIKKNRIHHFKTKGLFLFVCFIILLTLSSFISKEETHNSKKFVVVLDAGHGGKDPGKPSKYGFKEKDIALKIVLLVGKELEKNPNIKVVYTRKTDVFIELADRPKIANKANADLFVSIHCNAHHTQAYGTETYVLDVGNTNRNFEVAKAENEVIFLEDDYHEKYGGFNPNSPESFLAVSLAQEEYTDQSILLASLIEKNFANKIKRKSRGVKQASLWVIHQTAMPSVLIETGFVTNKSEGAYLNSSKGQQEISTSIVNAILEYKNSLVRNTGEDYADIVEEVEEHINETPNDIVFKIQIAASSKAIDTKPYNFKGLDSISRLKEGNLYKYFYGKTANYQDTKMLEEEAKRKGYTSCFVVAFKADKKIDLVDAIKSTAN
ncbi:N-acetylmuramoyl-L-alanine amidase [Sabulilitoribacter multivorans]|uniref:N-acetylmuramoyl-L-alanine amidase n=1 Tax=Flaviramulus multivorans TaxID=1304750 RepID=A0ABS9IHS4_9FLAO|nr:N-acetylmuramoyl-L-alanine amidase [Flaviramulus multivorans]MCF7560118.1 N-acetylmuramoyl-L-alanine amidase [Flaviramulus multivorans]